MPNLLALPNTFGKANRPQRPANVLADGVPRYEDLPKRLREIVDELKAAGHDRRSLSEIAKRSHGWVDSVLVGDAEGNAAGPGAIALARLCEEFGYNVRWLVTGLGPKVIDRADDVRAARERSELQPQPRREGAEPTAKPSLSPLKTVPQPQKVKPTKRARG